MLQLCPGCSWDDEHGPGRCDSSGPMALPPAKVRGGGENRPRSMRKNYHLPQLTLLSCLHKTLSSEPLGVFYVQTILDSVMLWQAVTLWESMMAAEGGLMEGLRVRPLGGKSCAQPDECVGVVVHTGDCVCHTK